MRRTALVIIALLLTPRAAASQELVWVAGACMIPDTTLVKVAVVPGWRVPCPVIVYNPLAWKDMPGPVALFVILHEYGHIALSHSPEDPEHAGWEARTIAKELDADCYAGRMMGERWPQWVGPISQWLESLGPKAPDATHAPYIEQAYRFRTCAGSSP